MRKIKEALGLYSLGLKQQQIGANCAISQSTVCEYVQAARVAGLSWPEIAGLDERALAARWFPERAAALRWRRERRPGRGGAGGRWVSGGRGRRGGRREEGEVNA
jgi:hypothetical protein